MTSTVSTVIELFKTVHQQLREVVEQVDEGDLDWSPGADMNSVAVLVTHTAGSELDIFHIVRGTTGERDRDAEFAVTGKTKADLLATLDQADARLDEYLGSMSDEDLATIRERPDRDPQTGRYWLLSNYGHAREHLAHAQMAVQLIRQRG